MAAAPSDGEGFRELVEHAGDMFARHDDDGSYVYVSSASLKVTGYPPEWLVGRHPEELIHPEDRAAVQALIADSRRRRLPEVRFTHRIVRADGAVAWLSVLLRIDQPDGGMFAVSTVRDITTEHEQSTQLLKATQLFERAFERTPLGMALTDLDGNWRRVNPALCEITGYPQAALETMGFREVTHPDDLDVGTAELRELLAGARESFDVQKRYVHADGHTVWVVVSVSVVYDERGHPEHLVTQVKDVSERYELEQRLTYLAEHDPLTGLFNRRRLEQELELQVARARRYGERSAVLMLDLDHFKYLNDALGHTVGDKVIAHVAAVLAGRLRASDFLARLGGDEYAAILPQTSAARARDVADALVRAIERNPFIHREHRYVISASVGVVIIDADAASAEDVIVNADLALYDAKQRGRNRVAVYSPSARRDVLSGLSWSQRLKEALAGDGFELYAQPIVALATGAPAMHELLIRLRGAHGQPIAPSEFLPAAAVFGYMPAIDRWVIENAARHAAACPGRVLTVNLAASTISEPDLPDFVAEQLARHGAAARDLVFEVSESDIVSNLDVARATCARLRALGARIALDDFGSGFSGFAYLKALDADLLKIDGQFIRKLGQDPVDALVVRSIVQVADGLGLPTVAEYVTSKPVLELLRQLGATYGQGFHLGRPQPLG